jgi:NhaP-type Na+/H+ or K+/H+ antiporter
MIVVPMLRRSAALAIIMMRAGLGLDGHMLRKLSFGVLRLAFIPCLVEAIAAGAAAMLILGLPWSWALMLG